MVVNGKEGGLWKLKRFNQEGTVLCCSELRDLPSGMTEVSLGGRTVIALSYR